MGQINWNELFPTRVSGLIFLGYMSLFVAQGILVTASQDSNSKYNYSTVTVVLLTEVIKLIASVVLYCREHSFRDLIAAIAKDHRVLLLYCVPAFLYCLYNNLAFVNLSKFDPTGYFLLLQIRVVITGVLFQVIFKKQLSRKQWLSLLLLTFGCMLKQLNFGAADKLSAISFLNVNLVFILIQTVCSCLAGVYNEYLLKREGSNVNIFVQNVFMYIDSIVFNIFVLGLVEDNLMAAFTFSSLSKVMHWNVLLIMFNNAAIGIITSFFLKTFNSILKTFASALELVFTAILSYIIFGIPIYLNTVLAIAIVSAAIYVYSQSPVNNNAPTGKDANRKKEISEDAVALLIDNGDSDADGDVERNGAVSKVSTI